MTTQTGIGDIENAMIAKIKEAQDSSLLGYKLKKIATYGGEFADGLDRAVPDFPAVLVAFSGADLRSQTNNVFTFVVRFAVICCANSLRNETAARQGAGAGVGSYQIFKDMILLLGGQNFGLDIGELEVRGVTPLVNDKAGQQLASVYGVNFETTWTLDITGDIDALGFFETFHANWDIPNFGNVSTDLPADSSADATDHITLET